MYNKHIPELSGRGGSKIFRAVFKFKSGGGGGGGRGCSFLILPDLNYP